VEKLRAAAARKGLDLVVNVEPAAEAEALGDPDRLAQVLGQLLDNAVKFTAAGAVTLAADAAAGQWRFAVRDTGVGIDPSQAERLFAGFELGDASATREHGGAGLGLAICRRLTGLMGGRIEADGAPGQGAVFTLVVPMSPALPVSAAGRPLKVLVADDNATNRKVVELILDAVGAEVVGVENGADAVAAAAADGVDLILMDLQMPVMDGLTAIAAIRRAEAAAGRPRRPIVVLSANSAPADVEASHLAGADGHLGKPIRPDVLLAALAEATTEKA
jgi:CheY-like chemotaxis protein